MLTIWHLFSKSYLSCYSVCPQKACEHQQQEEAQGCFIQGLSCPVLTDLHHSLLSGAHAASSSRVLAKTDEEGSSLLPPVCSLICPAQLQIPVSALTPRPTCHFQTFDTTSESPHQAQSKVDDPCVQRPPTSPDQCKVGSWWRQDIETRGATSALLPATDPGTGDFLFYLTVQINNNVHIKPYPSLCNHMVHNNHLI